jgi:Flp pilus assembly pilin Flp
VAKKTATKPAATQKSAKPVKAKKVKLVRDSFTMPETEYALIAGLKARCLAAGVSAKKSEILRAAVAGLAKLGDAALLAALRKLDVIKTGRPAKQVK